MVNKKVNFYNLIFKTIFLLDKWDVVVTYFFLETALNIFEYMELIYKILKPGGVWINCGDLSYTIDSEEYHKF